MPASALIAGHTDSVLCCMALPSLKLLASGGEDGAICLTDLANLKTAGRLPVQPLGDAVPSLCCLPGSESTLFAAAGPTVLHLDLRCLASSSGGGAGSSSGGGGGGAAVVQAWAAGQEEVNNVAATAANGGWLAAADDAGEVQVISLSQSAAAEAPAAGAAGAAGAAASPAEGASAVQAAEAAPPPLPRAQRPPSYKTLRRGHTNICSAVAFRPHRPWELLSGGLDCSVVQWDFSRLRPLHAWGMSGDATASGGQLLNPPMVHSLAVPQTDDRSLCRLMAVGRGDGCISLYDVDSSRQPAASTAAGCSGGGGKKGGKGRGKGRGGGDSQRQVAAAPPGRLALLGTEQGSHTAAVNCVAFYQGPGAGWQHLLSAGNDCRLLLWDWRIAAAAGREASEVAAEQAAGAEAAATELEAPTSSIESSGRLRQGDAKAPEGADEAAAAGGGGSSPLLAAEHRHGRKINWACSADVAGCPYGVFLADTGRRITALALAP